MQRDKIENLGRFMNLNTRDIKNISLNNLSENSIKDFNNENISFIDSISEKRAQNELSTKLAVESFIKDPFEIELHTDFCDNLLSRGYKLEEAIQKTDTVFETLKDKNTYNIN